MYVSVNGKYACMKRASVAHVLDHKLNKQAINLVGFGCVP